MYVIAITELICLKCVRFQTLLCCERSLFCRFVTKLRVVISRQIAGVCIVQYYWIICADTLCRPLIA